MAVTCSPVFQTMVGIVRGTIRRAGRGKVVCVSTGRRSNQLAFVIRSDKSKFAGRTLLRNARRFFVSSADEGNRTRCKVKLFFTGAITRGCNKNVGLSGSRGANKTEMRVFFLDDRRADWVSHGWTVWGGFCVLLSGVWQRG